MISESNIYKRIPAPAGFYLVVPRQALVNATSGVPLTEDLPLCAREVIITKTSQVFACHVFRPEVAIANSSLLISRPYARQLEDVELRQYVLEESCPFRIGSAAEEPWCTTNAQEAQNEADLMAAAPSAPEESEAMIAVVLALRRRRVELAEAQTPKQSAPVGS